MSERRALVHLPLNGSWFEVTPPPRLGVSNPQEWLRDACGHRSRVQVTAAGFQVVRAHLAEVLTALLSVVDVEVTAVQNGHPARDVVAALAPFAVPGRVVAHDEETGIRVRRWRLRRSEWSSA